VSRSYFSRVLRGGGSATLAPPRPVTTLWKAARIDRTANVAPVEEPAPASVLSRRRASPPVVTETGLTTQNGVESKAEPGVEVTVRPRPVMREKQAIREAPTRVGPRKEPAIRAAVVPGHSKPSPAAIRTEPKTGKPDVTAAMPGSVANRKLGPLNPPAVESARVRRQEPLVSAEQRRPVAELSPEPRQELHPEPRRAANAGPESTPERPERAGLAPIADALAPERAAFAQARTEARRLREPGVAQEEPRAAARNGVQIGKIEIQVVSPPGQVRHAPAAAPARGRLARGYALWAAWP
jgi:hypothetical protein